MEHPTWRRVVNGVVRESVLDHVYVKDYFILSDLTHSWPIFGDHAAVIFNIGNDKEKQEQTTRRDWRGYSEELLCNKLLSLDWNLESDSVQDFWNELENRLIGVVDEIAPLATSSNNTIKTTVMPPNLKNKINIRKRLIKSNKNHPCPLKLEKIKSINKEIKSHYNQARATKVRRSIIPGNTASLWKAVKIAKDVNITELPNTMRENGVEIEKKSLPDRLASFFYNRVKNLADSTTIKDDVYNGKKKTNVVQTISFGHRPNH